MLSGTVATALSFIDNFHIKNIAIFIFDITECILNAVDDISKTFSSIFNDSICSRVAIIFFNFIIEDKDSHFIPIVPKECISQAL